MPPAEFEPATPASDRPQTLTVGGLGTAGMVTTNGSIEGNKFDFLHIQSHSVGLLSFYHQTLDTSLKSGSLVRVIHPKNPPFEETRPHLLMRKHSDLLYKGIRNLNLFFHTYKPPEGYKTT
jgi:hypothetical protein